MRQEKKRNRVPRKGRTGTKRNAAPGQTAAARETAPSGHNGVISKQEAQEVSAVIHEPVTLTEEAVAILNDVLFNANAPAGRPTGLRRKIADGKKA